jgi:uncharacterized OB-fold protein
MVTIDKDGKPVIKTEARITYELALGPTWHRFFEGLKEEKILGTRCSECQRVLVPARGFCSHCFVEMKDWVEVSSEGILTGWALTDYEYFGMPTKPPFINCVIRLDGSDCGFMHLIGGFEIKDLDTVKQKVKNGMRVRAVWRDVRVGGIMDIQYFEPVSG